MSKKHFEKWEKDFIRLAYPIFDTGEIAKLLNRSKGVIGNFCYTKKIKKMPLIEIGDKLGRLTVVEKIGSDGRSGRSIIWLCECECGNKVEVPTNSILREQSCGCKRLEAIFTGYGEITGTWYGNVKKCAEEREIKFDVSLEYLDRLFKEQNYCCALSGIPIQITKGRSCKKYYQENTASLDRRDSLIHYCEGNVQFVHKDINRMKWTFDQDHFLKFCEIITDYQRSKK